MSCSLRSTTTLGEPLTTTLAAQILSTPPRGPFASLTRTVTRSIAGENFPSLSPTFRRMYERSWRESRTPLVLMLAGGRRAFRFPERGSSAGNALRLTSLDRIRSPSMTPSAALAANGTLAAGGVAGRAARRGAGRAHLPLLQLDVRSLAIRATTGGLAGWPCS
jgi:hypothetical protein